jgi:hypothetical protein
MKCAVPHFAPAFIGGKVKPPNDQKEKRVSFYVH